ncbi:MAG: hypothetical protein Q9O74_06115 [Planctomycetota bacterium]|nr:hypothetical protein [Planctomycetota bacterium]
MLAAANPIKSGQEPSALYDKAPGYGIVRLSRADRTITCESWPRWVDPTAPDAACYPGWPVTMKQADNGGSLWEWLAFDSISMENLEQHTLTVRRTGETEPLYTIRLYNGFVPRLPDAGPWSFETRNTVTGEVTMMLPDIPASRGIDSFWNNLRKNRKYLHPQRTPRRLRVPVMDLPRPGLRLMDDVSAEKVSRSLGDYSHVLPHRRRCLLQKRVS